MKRTAIISLSILALVGCAKEVAQNDNTPQETVKYMTFNAVFEDDVTDHDTKATLDRNGNFSWDSFETIYFVDGSGNTATGSYDASTEKVTVEEGDWLTASSNPLSTATKLAGFGGNGPIVVAKVDGPVLKFHHIGSVINLKFASIPLNCSLTFSSSTQGGDGTFSFDGDVPTLAGGTNAVSVSCPVSKSDDPVDVTISVPNLSYSGFTVQLSVGGKAFFQKITEKTFDLSERPTLLNMKQLALPVYTVCGSKNGTAEDDKDDAGIFGSTWSPSTSANDMVLDTDGYYKKSYTDANAPIKLKVVQDRDWDVAAWPDGYDKTYDTANNGSDFTVKFNPVDNSIDFVNCNHAYVVAGIGNWSVSSSNRLSSYNSTTLYKRYSDIEAGTIEYKFVKNYISWLGDNNISKTVSSTGDIIITYYTDSGNNGFFQEGTPYSVAGDKNLTGYEWSTSENDMDWTEEDFIVTKTFNNVPSGEHKFKVVVNHSWDENYGGSGDNADGSGNYVFTLSSKKDVTIKFNILTHVITVE